MEFEKNAKTHGKLMEKIFVNKKKCCDVHFYRVRVM